MVDPLSIPPGGRCRPPAKLWIFSLDSARSVALSPHGRHLTGGRRGPGTRGGGVGGGRGRGMRKEKGEGEGGRLRGGWAGLGLVLNVAPEGLEAEEGSARGLIYNSRFKVTADKPRP